MSITNNKNKLIHNYTYKKYFVTLNRKIIKFLMIKHIDLFNKIFLKLIEYCFLFNSLNNNRFVHITGGSSIKYHMIINNIKNHENITNTIDLFLVTNNKESINNINSFFNGLLIWFSDYDLKINNNKDLHIITILGVPIINIKIFDEYYIENDVHTSILYYALIQLNYYDFFDYFRKLENQNIKNKTISTLEVEKYSCVKGVILQMTNTNNTYFSLIKNPYLSERRKKLYKRLFYKNTKEKKIISFEYKLDIINKMLA